MGQGSLGVVVSRGVLGVFNGFETIFASVTKGDIGETVFFCERSTIGADGCGAMVELSLNTCALLPFSTGTHRWVPSESSYIYNNKTNLRQSLIVELRLKVILLCL